MPEPLNPYEKVNLLERRGKKNRLIFQKIYYKDYTSTTWKPEPYKPPKFEKEAELQPLPKYYPPYLKASHNPQIPYREVTTKKEEVQPYEHVFPTYTTTTTTTTTTYSKYI